MDTSKIDELFQNAKKAEISPSPFFEARVKARMRTKMTQMPVRHLQIQESPKSFWKSLTTAQWAFVGVALAGMISILPIAKRAVINRFEKPTTTDDRQSAQTFAVGVPKVLAIRLSAEVANKDIRFVRILIPEGVKFHSEKLALKISNLSELILNVPSGSSSDLPVVLVTQHEGNFSVKVEFLDGSIKTVGTRELVIESRAPLKQGGP